MNSIIISQEQKNTKLPEKGGESAKKKKPFWKRLRNFLLVFTILVLGLFFLLSYLVRLPSVQQDLVNRATTWLSKELKTEVKIDYVSLDFFDQAILDGILIKDLDNDTLLYAKRLKADIAAFSILRNQLIIEDISLNTAVINLKKKEGADHFNFQFLADFFAPEDNGAPPAKNNWLLGISQLNLKDIDFRMVNEPKGEDMFGLLDKGSIALNGIELDSVLLDIKTVELDGVAFRFKKTKGPQEEDEAIPAPTSAQPQAATKGFTLKVGDINLNGGHFIFDDTRFEAKDWEGIDFPHLDVKDISIVAEDFLLQDWDMQGNVKQLTANEKSGFTIEKLKGFAKLSPTRLEINDLSLSTPYSKLGDTLLLKYREFGDFLEFPDKVTIDARLHNTEVALKDIIKFAPKLNNSPFIRQLAEEKVKLDGTFKGKINKLRGKDITLSLHNNATVLKGDFRARDLTLPEETLLDFKLTMLRTSISEIKKLLPAAKIPPNFSKLGDIRFSGNFTGFYKDFVADGALVSDLGRVNSDLQIQLREGMENAVYSGNLSVIDFDLATWSGNPQFGMASFSSKVNGKGTTINTVKANLDARVEGFDFKGYKYENVLVDGFFEQKKFAGKLFVDEENLRVTFDGKIDFNDSLPVFDLDASVKELNLLPLNLVKQPLSFAGDAKLNFQGNNLDNFAGSAAIYDLNMTKDSTVYAVDSIVLKSLILGYPRKRLEIQSDVLLASIEGEFDILQLPNSMAKFVEVNYPNWADKAKIQSFMFVNDTIWSGPAYTIVQKPVVPRKQDFKFNIDFLKTTNLAQLVVPDIQEIDKAGVSGSFNSVAGKLVLDGKVDKITFKNIDFEKIVLGSNNIGNKGDIIFRIGHINISDSLQIPPVNLEANMAQDTLAFSLDVANITEVVKNLNINGVLFPEKEYFQMSLLPSNLKVFNNEWVISGDNYVRFATNFVRTKNVVLKNGEEKIELNSFGEKGLQLSLANIDLGLIHDLVKIKNFKIGGQVNGALSVQDIYTQSGVQLDATVTDVKINEDEWGLVNIKANADKFNAKVRAEVELLDGTNSISATGFYTPPYATKDPKMVNRFDFEVIVDDYSVAFAEYFLPLVISDPIGKFDAKIRLFGIPSDPNIAGSIHLFETSVMINFLQTRYFLDDIHAKVSNTLFDVTGNTVRDNFGNTATLSGGIYHNKLRNFGLNTRIATDEFLILNTEKNDNPLFYGVGYGAARAHFIGPFTQIDMDINVKTMKNSHLTIPIGGATDAKEVSFIDFVVRDSTVQESATKGRTDIRGINLNLNLEITPEADIYLIFDEKAGDVIHGNGAGNINVKVTRTGEFAITGDYEIASGEYLFTYQSFINKPFAVKPGGTVRWSGDPYNAIIDVDAYYSGLRVSPYNFIVEYLTGEDSGSEIYNAARNSTEVNLLMKLQGELLNPDINFDIEFPAVDNDIRGYIDSKLNAIRADNNELNRQVFGLIVLGNFLPPAEFSAGGAGTVLGVNTLSELITSQLSLYLNDLLSEVVGEGGVISSIDFDVNYHIYKIEGIQDVSQSTITTNQIQLGVKNKFLNDRLAIGVGGNIDIESTKAFNETASSASYIAGNFVIEYLITADGRYKIRAYNRIGTQDDNIDNNKNETGIGLSYRKQFDDFNEFIESFKQRATERRAKRAARKTD